MKMIKILLGESNAHQSETVKKCVCREFEHEPSLLVYAGKSRAVLELCTSFLLPMFNMFAYLKFYLSRLYTCISASISFIAEIWSNSLSFIQDKVINMIVFLVTIFT